MSIELILIPAAIAGISAWKTARATSSDTGRTVCHVGTRMRDPDLLAAALADAQASVHPGVDIITARWVGVQADFHRDAQGIWQVDMTGDVDVEQASTIVAAVDQAYGRRVQAAVLARIRERAGALGMHIESENLEDDMSVTLTLEMRGEH